MSALDEARDDYLAHFETCAQCTLFAPCRAGASLMERVAQIAAMQIAPMPTEPGKA